MKKSVFKSGTLLAAALFLASLNLQGQEITRDYHKEYRTEKGDKVELSNKYGDILVETSETNQLVIDVIVTIKHPSRERAEKLMSYIDVKFSEGDNLFSAKTYIDDKFSFTGWGSDSRRFSIDYNVKMPVWLDLSLENRYGRTELDEMSGLVDLDIKYGNLKVSKLSRGNEKPWNTIIIAHGKASIDEAGWLDATVRYSGSFSIPKSQAILLDSRYSTVQFGNISSLVGESKYDKLRVESINNLNLESGYTDVNIGSLLKKLVFDGGYGSFNIEKVPSGFESIQTNTRYTGVRIGIDGSANYNLEAKLSYGKLYFNEENYSNRTRIVENNSTEVSGTVGMDESPAARVQVVSSYGSVKLY